MNLLFRLRDIDAHDLPEMANEAMRDAHEQITRLLDGLARIKRISDGRSPAWQLAYEALTNAPFSFGTDGAPLSAHEARS